ncbi:MULTISPECIES: polysaccharide deacetylase family protein [unclassified Duganella]|uniref:polysaccharide deacetylase family protein n=1 Tax=unclassified Duganella TaxID=2636909 RepID=UPI001E46AEF4|nr:MULTISPECIES: polysaccharide deacetylase family protein [unclassified Duganella]
MSNHFSRLLLVLCSLLLGPCAVAQDAPPAPIRFLLTFDDGPAAADSNNPTVHILETLASNPLQDHIKAVFFTQTRAWHGGGTAVGRTLIRREYDEGHVVALHSATTFHSNHRLMSRAALDESMQRGVDDLIATTGVAPKLVRPPFWAYNADTLESYHQHGMRMLLTDLSANDGKIYGVNFSWHKRSNMLTHLAETRKRWAAGAMPSVDGSTPVVVTFHDVNTYTSRHIQEYLEILLDVARELDVPLAAKPFYDERAELERAALARTVDDAGTDQPLPGLWNWLWR